MNKYLLEIGTEELPYKFIPSALKQLKMLFENLLKEHEIGFESIETFATPRRLCVIMKGFDSKQKDMHTEIKGPSCNVAFIDGSKEFSKAALGFARKNNVDISKLFEKDGYIFAKIEKQGKKIEEILKSNVEKLIFQIQGSHFMRWNDNSFKFQRPIRFLVSILNDELLPLSVANIQASRFTRGHRFKSDKVEITSIDSYKDILRKNNVIVDQNERKETIIRLAQEKANEIGADSKLDIDDDLLEEVVNITEWPVAVVCEFDKKYLKIPQKVIVTVMAVHQRYFPLYKDGKLLNKFITMANFIGNDFDNIKNGNQKVVTARLEDAIFFVKEDTKTKLIDKLEGLKGMTFQKGMGSIYDKTLRIKSLCKRVCQLLEIDSTDIERAAMLSKCDLNTHLVFEFTELQGFIGTDYALNYDEEKVNVANAIQQHYFPLNSKAEIAKSIEGKVVGLCDKIDTICSVFAIGKKPSGTSDPLGVRRAVLGVFRTILDGNLNLDILQLFSLAISNLPVNIQDQQTLIKTIDTFCKQRLINYFEHDFSVNLIKAAIDSSSPLVDLKKFTTRLKTLQLLTKHDKWESFLKSAVRVSNIINGKQDYIDVDEKLFNNIHEKNLYDQIKEFNDSNFDYEKFAFKLLELDYYISNFFDNVLVNDQNETVKINRIRLLSLLDREFSKIVDFSQDCVKSL